MAKPDCSCSMLDTWTAETPPEVSLEFLRTDKLPDWPYSDTISYYRCKLCEQSWAEHEEWGMGTWWTREPMPPA